MKIDKIFQSLSLKLITVFLITAIAYLYLLTVGVRSLILNDEVRETLGYYQTSYLENFLEDLRYPPTQERSEEVASNMPFDIKIIGDDFSWASTSQFPDLDVIDFQKSNRTVSKFRIMNGNDDALLDSGDFGQSFFNFLRLDVLSSRNEHAVLASGHF